MSLLLLLVGGAAPSRPASAGGMAPRPGDAIAAFEHMHHQALEQQALARRQQDERDEDVLMTAILRSRLRI